MVRFATSQLVTPSPGDRLLRGSSLDSDWLTSARAARGQAPAQQGLTGNYLGAYVLDKGRPYSGMGKLGFGVSQAPQFRAGGTSPHAPGMDVPVQSSGPDPSGLIQGLGGDAIAGEAGFFENLLGGLGGVIAGQGGINVGRTLGSLPDFGLAAVGEAVNLPLGFLTSIPTLIGSGGFDPEVRAEYQKHIEENPLNAVFLIDDMARRQWEKDVASGKVTGLLRDMGPATNLWEALGLLGSGLSLPMRVTHRALGEGNVYVDQLMQATQQGKNVNNEFYASLQDKYRQGLYGPQGSQEARDKMLDEIIVEMHGSPERGPDVAEAGLFSTQTLTDLIYYTMTDPLIVADIAAGIGTRAASMAAREVGAKVLSAIPETGLRESFIRQTEEFVMAARKVDDPDVARAIMNREPNTQIEAYRDVAYRPEFDAVRQGVLDNTTYMDRFYNSWYPQMKPVINLVHTLNNPLELFGRKGVTVANNVFSHHTTEGWLRGAGGIQNFIDLKNEVGAVAPEVVPLLDNGAGVMAHFTSRVWYRRELVSAIKKIGGVFHEAPTIEAEAGLSGLKGTDLSVRVEQEAARHAKQFLSLTPEQMRQQAAERLVLLGVKQADAAEITATFTAEKAAMVDAVYFGHASSDLLNIVDTVVSGATKKTAKGKLIDLQRLTPLGPEQMTTADAPGVLAAVKAKDIHAVRDYIERFDLLRDNIGDRARSDAEVFKLVKQIVEGTQKQKGLPEMVSASAVATMDKRIGNWVATNAPLGYRLGFKPPDDAIWGVVKDADGHIVSVNPWIDITNKAAASARDLGRIQLARERLFHNIRGERIMTEARHEFNRITTREAGLSKGEADALFSRIMQKTEDLNITPRGLSSQQVWEVVMTHGFPSDLIEQVGSERKWAEMLVRSFEGKLSMVGATQKFSGKLKSVVAAKTSNYLGVMAEAIYPLIRFVWSPIFQGMELTEPWVLNIARGIKPGMKPTDIDRITGEVIQDIVGSSPRVFDDQTERTDWFLWGQKAAKELAGPQTAVSKASERWFGKDFTVGKVKKVNYTRLFRDNFGETFFDAAARVQPDLLPSLIAHYGTGDRGVLAVKYMTEQSLMGQGTHEFVLEALNAQKAHDLGAVETIVLSKMVALMPDQFDSPEQMRAAIKAGTFSRANLEEHLASVSADPQYVKRAWEVATADAPDEQWLDYLNTFARGNHVQAARARQIVQARAAALGLSEEEYMARRVAGFASADMADFTRLSANQRAVIQRQTRLADHPRTVAQMVPNRKVRESLLQVYREHRYADREHGAIISATTGEITWQGSSTGPRTLDQVTGQMEGEGLGMDIPSRLSKDNITVHIHPWDAPFSPPDVSTAIVAGEAESWVMSPTRWYRIRPGAGATDWMDKFPSDIRDTLRSGAPGDDLLFARNEVAHRMFTSWRSGLNKWGKQLEHQPWYQAWVGTYTDPILREQERDAQIADMAWRDIADQNGWDYDSGIIDRTRPETLDDIINVLNDPGLMAEPHFFIQKYNRPQSIATTAEKVTGGQALTRTAYETIAAGEGAARARWIPDLDTLDPPVADAVARDVQRWVRQRSTELTGTPIVRAVDAHGGWFNPAAKALEESPNAVDELLASDLDAEVNMLVRGHLGQQTTVVGWRSIGAQMTDLNHAKGQRWAYTITAPYSMTPEQAIRFQRAFTEELTGLSGWGYALDQRADGKYALTFIDHSDPLLFPGVADAPSFVANRVRVSESDLEGAVGRAADRVIREFNWPLNAEFKGNPDAILYKEVSNDWTVNPRGQSFTQRLAELGRSDIVADVENRLTREGDDVIADAFQRHAPVQFDAHLNAVRAGGGTYPDFRVPPDDLSPAFPLAPYEDAEFAYPGGKGRLYDSAAGPLSLQDLIRFKNQPPVDPNPWWVRDPETMARFYRQRFAGQRAEFRGDPGMTFNYMTYGAVSSGTDLTTSENLFTTLRVNGQHMPFDNGLDEAAAGVQRMLRSLPDWARDDPTQLAVLHEAETGLRQSPFAPDVGRWVKAERLAALRREVAKRAKELDAALQTDAEVATVYKRINREMKDAGFGELYLHPVVPSAFTSVSMPIDTSHQLQFSMMRASGRIRSVQSNAQVGRVLGWLGDDGPYRNGASSMPNGLKLFMTPQMWETQAQFAARMASIHGGLGAKTAVWAVGVANPGKMGLVVMDRHNLRRVFLDAARRNDVETLLGDLRPAYADKVRTWLREGGEVPPADGRRVTLLAGARAKWRADPQAALAKMRAKLDGIPGETWSDLYRRDSDVLELVALQNDGKILVFDGTSDYEKVSEAYMAMVRREMEDMRAAGHGPAVDIMDSWSPMEHGWSQWEKERGQIDPHLMASPEWYSIPPMGPAEQHKGRIMTSPYPDQSFSFQRQNEETLGATIAMQDGRAWQVATHAATVETGTHEMWHLFEKDLDPSLRNVILDEYYKVNPDASGGWDEAVSEWAADEWRKYLRTGRTKNPKMKQPLAAFSKWFKAAAQEDADRVARQVAVATKRAAVTDAKALLSPHQAAIKAAEQSLGKAQRARDAAAKALRNARQRTGVSDLTERLTQHDATIQSLSDQATMLRQAEKTDELAEVNRALVRERRARTRTNIALRGAKRRTSITALEERVASFQKDVDAAVEVWRTAKTAASPAEEALAAAEALATKARGKVDPDAPSAAMHDLFERMLKEPEVKAMNNSPVTLDATYDLQQQAMYGAARMAARMAEEDAFRVHYFKRGRNIIERSINHPYFGLYPASYMWGKILPELIRFLAKKPFGLEAPLGGLLMSNVIYRQVMMEQAYDEDTRRWFAEHEKMWQLLGMFMPATPWEVPVNAPLWARRVAEHEAIRAQNVYQGETDPTKIDQMSPQQLSSIATEMVQYAFGPAQSIQYVGEALGVVQNAGDIALSQANSSIDAVLNPQAQPQPQPYPLSPLNQP